MRMWRNGRRAALRTLWEQSHGGSSPLIRIFLSLMQDSDFYWLWGLFEGEGSFTKGQPSCPQYPVLNCIKNNHMFTDLS
jgi:hypothetical protein